MEAKAARIIQKRYREYAMNKQNLTETQKGFIRPWCKRWRAKSIFQVLLLYRAERLQTLVNFCLQVHLYNQNSLKEIHKINDQINLEDVDLEAKALEYLPPLKPSIPKLQFMWKSLNLQGDLNNCEPLPNCHMELLEAELYAKLNKKIGADTKESKVDCKNYEDKEIQTSLLEENGTSQNIKEEAITVSNTIICQQKKELEKEQVEKEKSKMSFESKEERETSIKDLINDVSKIIKKAEVVSTLTRTSQTENNTECRNSTKISQQPPIKSRKNSKANLVLKRKFETSLDEMEEKFRNKNYKENGDDPPFNFRILLKKTIYTPESRKSSQGNSISQKQVTSFNFCERKNSLMSSAFGKYQRPSDVTAIELAPGILIYGKVADL